MKRFITVFATLIFGATLFSTAMAQGKPGVSGGTPKKHVATQHMKNAVHRHKTMAKRAAHKAMIHKMAAHKVALKTARKGASHPAAKHKARRPVAQTGRVRTSHGSPVKSTGKRSAQVGRTPLRLKNTRPLNNGNIKGKSAPKAGKVVNRR